jgi:integral membrane protein (TIGR01906 family)
MTESRRTGGPGTGDTMAAMDGRPSALRAGTTVVVALLTAIVVVAVAILPFLTPTWFGFEQGRADAAGWTGYAPADLRKATDSILHDLVLGPPDFAVEVNGAPVLDERERGHMRDVRNVFGTFYLVALGAAIVVALIAFATRASSTFWRGIRYAGVGMTVAMVVGGAIVAFAFDAAFEVFHRLLFPSGSYTFDPRTERLVQLFPETLWIETAVAVGTVIVALALALTWFAGRRLRERALAAVARTAAAPEAVR